MLTDQQVETFIYSFRASIDQLQAQQTKQNALLNGIQTQLNSLTQAVTSLSSSTGGGSGSSIDSYPVAGGIVHKLKHYFQAAVQFLSDVAIQGTLSLTNALGVGSGGTGRSSLTAHKLLVGNGTSGINGVSSVSSGYVLTDNGGAADPTFQAAVNSFNSRTGAVTLGSIDIVAAGGVLSGAFPGGATVTLAKLTGGGSNGSLTVNSNGEIIAYTPPT